MAAMAGILNHSMTAGQALRGNSASPMANATGAADSSGSSSGADSSSSTISSNDFLSLLVTEMQNQDPTAQTDPNEYIDQLVQVNSLEQLIDINQNLSTALGTSGTGSSGSGSSGAASVASGNAAALMAKPGMPAPASTPPGSNVRSAIGQIAQSAGAQQAPGNLGVPVADPAATRVGHALDGRKQRTVLRGELPLGH